MEKFNSLAGLLPLSILRGGGGKKKKTRPAIKVREVSHWQVCKTCKVSRDCAGRAGAKEGFLHLWNYKGGFIPQINSYKELTFGLVGTRVLKW